MKQAYSRFIPSAACAPRVSEQLPDALITLGQQGVSCLLVVMDAAGEACTAAVFAALDAAQVAYATATAVTRDTIGVPQEECNEALQAYLQKQAQGIIAIGGACAMTLAQSVLCALHSRQHAQSFAQWNQIPLLMLPVADVRAAAWHNAVTVVRKEGKLVSHSLCRHENRTIVQDKTLLPPQTQQALGQSIFWGLAHAVCAQLHPLLPKKAQKLAEAAVMTIRQQSISVFDDALLPEEERFSNDHVARQALQTAFAEVAQAAQMACDTSLMALLDVLGTRKAIAMETALPLLLPPFLRQLSGNAQKRVATLVRRAFLSQEKVSDEEALSAFASWIQDFARHTGCQETLPGVTQKEIPALARETAAHASLDRFALERMLCAAMEQTATPETLEELFQLQQAFFATRATLPVAHRMDALHRLHMSILSHEKEIEQALAQDLGKCAEESYLCEVGMVLSELRWMMRHLRKLCQPTRVLTPLAQFPSRSMIVHEPYGVTLIMSPWNYPFLLTLSPLIGALAGGNCCVLKVSKDSPHTGEIIRTICAECFPVEQVSVVTGGRQENQALLDLPFDKIFFTGSKHVGQEVLRRAAEHVTPVTLELGGKSPVIVDETANIALAARRIAFGKLLNAGQTCVAPDYVLVDRRVADALVQSLKAEFAKHCPQPLQNDQYPHIVNAHHFARLTQLIVPGQCVFGGEADEGTLKIAPTLLRDVSPTDAVMQEEIFGPILPILMVDNVEEAMTFVSARPKPLACYLFTSDKAVQRRVLQELPFGGGCVNDTIIHLATSRMPFGGVGESGMGGYHGRDSFRCFTHDKSVVNKATWLDLPMRYAPYTKAKSRLVRFFLK